MTESTKDKSSDDPDTDAVDEAEGVQVEEPAEEQGPSENERVEAEDIVDDDEQVDAQSDAGDVDDEDIPADAVENDVEEIKPKRRRRRLLWGLFYTLVVLAGLAVLAGYMIVGRPLVAPDWLRERIETQVNQQLGAVQIGLGQVTLVVEEGWHPRVQIHDVDFADLEGRPLLTLADVEGTLALRPLLSGQVQPARVWLTGAQLQLRRDETGQVGLSFGEGGSSIQQAASFVQLIEEVDRVLVSPTLADLQSISADGLTVRYEDARARRAWTVDGGRVNLIRKQDNLTLRGDFALLSGGASAATVEMSYESRIGSAAARFGISFADVEADDIAAQSAALLWLNVLRAPISGSLRGSTGEDGELGPVSATLQIGDGVLQPTDETQPIPFRAARSYFTYDPQRQSMRFDEMIVDSEWGSLQAEGRVVLGQLENGLPKDFTSQMRISQLSVNPQDMYPVPIRFSDVTMDMRMTLDPFRVTLGEMTLRDGASQLLMRGELNARETGWDLSLNGKLDRLAPERLVELWPVSVVPNTRNWINANVLGGDLNNVQIGLNAQAGKKPVIYLGWEFDQLDTLFMKTMPPILGAKGYASLYRNTLTITAESGRIQADQGGAVDIAGTVFVIPQVGEEFAPAFTQLRTKSTITAVLSLLDREPFRFISKSGQKVAMADGIARAQGRVDFRLKKNLPVEEVDYVVTADLSDVRSETLVPGRVLAASALKAQANKTELRITGEGRIGKLPFEGRFVAPLGPRAGGKSRIEGTVELSQRFVDEFRLGLPKGSVSGTGRGAVKIDMERGKRPVFSLTSNLAGLALRVPQIGWSIGQKTRGTLEVAGRLGDPMEVSEITLNAPGLRTTGHLELGRGGTFKAARFDRVLAGDWLDAPVALVGRGAGNSPEVVVSGGTVDLSQTEIGAGSGSGAAQDGGPMTIRLERLKISEGISLTGFSGSFTTAGGMRGNFAGKVNGGAPVTGRVVPQHGRSAFEITSNNAGGVFKSAGLLPNAHGGSMKLTLAPGGGTGVYEGQLNAKSVWLRKAPAMAALLNAISVVGLLEQLSGNGILFGQVEARFRLTPTQAIIARSSATGVSMGISMDGYYNLTSGAMNFQGVVSPFYVLNAVGAVLTRKGEGLIGFNYKLVGTTDNPKVKVNPLSLLTPGMFREIFRRPPPKLNQ
ncbi:AsmA-like C-terminal region-containing protein [Alisedimentitalea sp. MJ-SS2]|uniref:AsmA family protein n=1 Tax=Aliisedimentitalea sp. MJ-SS2 TaxID=3049795 RepID=UPI002915B55B|nr:AsmA-like C-terminal region-containing protein [Alisedimentitalea sp. MJ-SS2]MDU8929152.1 AsmA-like C-terminal region-containing protein [Alisedimentitalea sp. MJ-SS2]